ncbi:MAG: molybdopterin molybdotransferase MoeA [Nannocystaceae bacterium]|nr:molybdopterin molybdotransferase MoeA [Nannocystaceae bacterium]
MLPSLDDALARARAAASPLPSEPVAWDTARGRVLATAITAAWDLPVAAVSVMDGYAIDAAAVRRDAAIAVVGESRAGQPFAGAWTPGTAVRIATGAVVPDAALCVVPQEDVARERDAIVLSHDARQQAAAGRHVRPAGADARAGAMVLPAGTVLGPAEHALAGAVGAVALQVHRRPRVVVVSTGDELVAVGSTPAAGQVPSTSGTMLRGLLEHAGAELVAQWEVGDDAEALRRTLRDAQTAADVVLTTGGASVGDHDLVRSTLASLQARELLWGIAMRPGKPTGVVTLASTLLFALPGNPASTLVAFAVLVRPCLRALAGVHEPALPQLELALGGEVEGERGREHFVRARLHEGLALPLPDQRSGNLRSIAGAELLVRVPAGTTRLPAGARCRCLLLPSGGSC